MLWIDSGNKGQGLSICYCIDLVIYILTCTIVIYRVESKSSEKTYYYDSFNAQVKEMKTIKNIPLCQQLLFYHMGNDLEPKYDGTYQF